MSLTHLAQRFTHRTSGISNIRTKLTSKNKQRQCADIDVRKKWK